MHQLLLILLLLLLVVVVTHFNCYQPTLLGQLGCIGGRVAKAFLSVAVIFAKRHQLRLECVSRIFNSWEGVVFFRQGVFFAS